MSNEKSFQNQGQEQAIKPRVFHFKVLTNQDVRICVNICSMLSNAPANIDCEGLSITHIFYHILP